MQLGASGSIGVGVGVVEGSGRTVLDDVEGSATTVLDDVEGNGTTVLDGLSTCIVSSPLLS